MSTCSASSRAEPTSSRSALDSGTASNLRGSKRSCGGMALVCVPKAAARRKARVAARIRRRPAARTNRFDSAPFARRQVGMCQRAARRCDVRADAVVQAPRKLS
eukprot:362156-Chlamydomonas_euryale.AAC.19